MEVDEDYNEVISDPEFLQVNSQKIYFLDGCLHHYQFLFQSVLENLPGVDPQSETIRDAVGSLNKDKDKKSGESSDKDKKGK